MMIFRSVTLIAALIVYGVTGVCGNQFADQNSITWTKSSEVIDNTEEHLRNIGEKYQVMEDYILYLREDMAENGALYQLDRNGKKTTKLLENVCEFVEIRGKIYYTKGDMVTSIMKELHIYDKKKKSDKKLLGSDEDIYSLISVKGNVVYYTTYDKLVAYRIDKKTKKEMDYIPKNPLAIKRMVNGKIISVGNGCIDLIDFEKKKVKKLMTHKDNSVYSEDIVACTKDAIYYGVDEYRVDYSAFVPMKKVKTKRDGLWKFDLKTGKKIKIREKAPEKLHVLDGRVYDEALTNVEAEK